MRAGPSSSGLHRGDRAALDGDHPDPRHPVDRDRWDADPGSVGDRGDHPAAGAPVHARPSDQPAARHSAAGISPGVLEPFIVVAEHGPTPVDFGRVAARLDETPGLGAAVAPPTWRRDGVALLEAFPTTDASSSSATSTI